MRTPVSRTTHEMKINNVVLVTDALKSLGSATKAEAAAQTGLSVATCGTVLNDLCYSGEVLALELESSRGGRPAQRYACNPDFFSLLSLYAEGSDDSSNLVWSVTSATGQLLAQGEADFLPLTLESFINQAARLVKAYPNVKALGIGLPGVVAEGVVLSCDISLFSGVAIVDRLRERLGLYVQADNDMNYTAWGFYRSSGAAASAPVAYVLKPEVPCTGCGIVINGQLLQGASYFAGEVSYLPSNTVKPLLVMDELINIVLSLTAMINPATVALSGPHVSEQLVAQIRERCAERIPERHIPELVCRHSVRPDYLQGIAELTAQSYNLHRLFNC